MMNELVQELTKTPAFSSLPAVEIQKLVSLGREKSIHKGSFLCMQDDLWPYMVYLRRGQLRWAMLSMSGREHVLYYIEQKSVFWGHTLLDGGPMPASLMASKPSEIIIWHSDALHSFLNRNPETLWALIRYQTKVMRQARDHLWIGLQACGRASGLTDFRSQRCIHRRTNQARSDAA